MKRFVPLLLVLPALGFECEYFDPVVVPPADDNPPVMGTRVFIDGDEQIAIDSFHEDVALTTEFVVAPAMIDSGGARKLDVQQAVQVHCHDYSAEPEIGQLVQIDFTTRHATQNGSVGSSVSNGLYLVGDVTSLSGYEGYCSPGFDLIEVTYGWTMVGHDFAGNVAAGDGSITYVPPAGTCGCGNSGAGNICQPSYDGCGPGYHPHCSPIQGSCGGCSCE